MVLDIIAAHADKVDGIKVSLLDADTRDRAAAAAARGRAHVHRRRLQLPGADPATSRQRRAARHLRRDRAGGGGRAARARRRRPRRATTRCSAPTVPLSRHIFAAPTPYYKTGVVFLAYLNGHQQHFRMVGGLESGALGRCIWPSCSCSPTGRGCCATPSSRARACGTCSRWRGSRERSRLLSFNSMTADRWSLAEVIDALRRARHRVDRAVAAQGGRDRRRGGARGGSTRAGLKVSSLCRGGFFAADGRATRTTGARSRRRRRSAPTCSCSSAGRRVDRDLAAARAMIERGIERAAAARERARRPAGDRAAAPDDDRRALGDRHARRGARHRRADRRPGASAS